MADEFKEFNDKIEGKKYTLNVGAEVDSSVADAEKQVTSLVKTVEDGQKRLESSVRNSMESISNSGERASTGISTVKQAVQELSTETAASKAVVTSLITQINKMGEAATATAVATSQLGKTNQDAFRTIDQEYEKVIKDAAKMEKTLGNLPSSNDNSLGQEETALISQVETDIKDYKRVADVLLEARAQAVSATTGDMYSGGYDKAQTEEQKELYKQCVTAVNDYIGALQYLATLKQHVSAEEAIAAMEAEKKLYQEAIDAANAYREATGQAALAGKELHDIWSATSTINHDVGTEKSDALWMYDRNLAQQHGQEIVDLKINTEAFDEDVEKARTILSDLYAAQNNENLIVHLDGVEDAENYLQDLKDLLDYINEKGAEAEQATNIAAENGEDISELVQTVSEYIDAKELLEDAISELETYISDRGNDISESETASVETGINNEIEALKARKQELESELNELRQILYDPEWQKQYQTAVLNSDSESQQSLQDDVKEARDEYQRKYQELEAIKERIANIKPDDSSVATPESDEALRQKEEFYKRLEEMEQKAVKTAQEKRETQEQPDSSGSTEQVEQETKSYEELEKEIAAVTHAIGELREEARNGGDVNSIADQIKEAEAELKNLVALKKLLDGTNTKDNKPEKKPHATDSQTDEDAGETKRASTLVGLLKESLSLKAQLGAQRMSLFATDDVQGTMANIEAIESRIKELQGVFNNVKASPMASVGSALQSLASNGLQKIGSIAKTAGSALLSFTTRGLSMIASGAKTALSSLASLASRGFNAIRNGARGAVSGISSLMGRMKSFSGNTTRKMMRSLSGIKSMLVRRVKRQFISEIFNNAKQGLQNLAKYSSEFNNSMSSIKNSAKTTVGNLSVTFGNLINALAPVVTAVTSMINSVIVKINELFALLSGKTTVTTAKQATDDYAKSLKGAGGAAKDLNHQLYGFDEITRQEDNSGGGGGGGASGQIEYVESAISDFAQRIYDAIAAGKWEEAGALIGEKINGIVSTARTKLQELEPVCVEWASNIARLLNGLMDEVDYGEIGGLFGDGFNLVFSTVDTFLSTYHWGTLGRKLAEGLNGMFSTIRWGTIGKTFADGFDAVFLTISNFVANAKWSEHGSNLAERVTSFFDNIDFDVAVDAVTTGLNGIVEMFNSFQSNIDWTEIAKKISDSFYATILRINWANIRSAISAGINNLISMFRTIVEGDWLELLAEELGELVGGILDDIEWDTLAESARIGLGKIVSAFSTFVSRLRLPRIATKISSGINKFFAADSSGKTPFASAAKTASEGINQVIEAFKVLLSEDNGINFGQIRENLVGGINTLLAETDWDDLVSTVITGVGRVTTEFFKLVSGIMNPVDEAGNATENLGTKLSNAINNVFKDENGKLDLKMFDDLGESIGDAIKGVFENLNSFITGVDWEAVGKAIATALESIKWSEIGESIINLLGSAMMAAVKLADGLLGKALRNLLGLKDTVDTFNATGVKWAEELSGGMEKGMQSNSTKERMLSAAAAMATGLTDSSALGLMEESANKNAKWFVGGLTKASTWEQLKTDFAHAGMEISDSLAQSIFNNADAVKMSSDELYNLIYSAESAEQLMYEFSELGVNITQGFAESLVNSREPVVQAAEQLLLDLENASTMDEVKQAFSDAGLTITDALADSLKGQGAANISAALTLMAMGVDEATIAAMDMTHLSENLNAYMQDSKTDLTTIATELGAEVGNGVGYTIPAAIAEALGIGKQEVERVKGEMVDSASVSATEVSAGQQSGTDLGSGVAENTAEAIESGTGEVETATQGMTDSIATKISELPEEERKQAETMMNLILQAIQDGDPLVQAAIENAANAVVAKAQEILAGNVGYEIAFEFISGMNSAIASNGSRIIATVGTMSNWAIQRANVILSESNGRTIGSNVIIGMINGLNANGQTLVNTIAHICNVTAQTARNILGIHSPSTVFAEIGGYVMEGMVDGLSETGENAIRTVGEIANEIVNEGTEAGQIDASLGYIMSGLDTVESKMSRIAQIFSDIGEVVADMGRLEIPTVASGKVLPYRARVDTSSSTETNSVISGDVENALYSAVTRALRELDLDQTINLNMDGRKVAETVTRYQRQSERALGV